MLSDVGDSNQRLAELATITTTSVFNQVYHLQKPDYSRDVTEASNQAFVLVHLTSSLGTNVESRLLTELWRELATKFGDIKFCEIQADMCIEGYPERNTPTILIYRMGDIKRQLVTLKELGGQRTRTEGWHYYLDLQMRQTHWLTRKQTSRVFSLPLEPSKRMISVSQSKSTTIKMRIIAVFVPEKHSQHLPGMTMLRTGIDLLV